MGILDRSAQGAMKESLSSSSKFSSGGGGGKGMDSSIDSLNYNPKKPWKGERPVPQVKSIPLELIKRSIS